MYQLDGLTIVRFIDDTYYVAFAPKAGANVASYAAPMATGLGNNNTLILTSQPVLVDQVTNITG